MNKMKKSLAILVAIVMCFVAFGMVASAAEFNPKVYLNLTYADNKAEIVNANISTDVACGAIQATLKFTGATYNSANFAEAGDASDKLVVSDNQIKFVIVTDKLTQGDKNWANFKFKITGDATFELVDVSVCDVDAGNLKDYTVVAEKNIVVNTTLRSLGAQYRQAEGETVDALRFGANLKRTKETSKVVIGDGEYTAVACGYIAGFDFNIIAKTGSKEALNTYVTLEGNELKAIAGRGVIVKKSQRYLESTDTELIYTYAITGLKDADAYNEHILADEAISVLPYVIYIDGDKYKVSYGEEISKSYNEVVNAHSMAN